MIWLVVLLLVVAPACSPKADAPGASSRGSTTAPPPRAVTLPDLSRMEEGVQGQMREAFGVLTSKRDTAGTPPADLAAAYRAMGELLMAAEYLDAAEACFLHAQALVPGERRWPYYLGHVYRTKGDPDNAAQAFERARALAPDDVATLVWLGEAYLDEGHPERAAPMFAQAAALQPRSVAALAGEGRAALADRQFARAAERLERALSIDPRASMVHYPLALAYRGLGQTDKAEAHLRLRGDVEVGPADPLMQELAGLLQSAASYEARGVRALDAGDWNGAATAFRAGIALAPGLTVTSASLHQRLGTALSQSGDMRGAAEEFQEAIRRDSNNVPARFSLGVLLAASGRVPEAIEQFTAAVGREPGNADVRLQLAIALLRAMRYQEAREQLLIGQKMSPSREEFVRLLQQFRPAR